MATTAALLSAVPASAASPDLVISQVYGGGGNSGATYTNDFIELYNRGSASVDLTGWAVQYASSAGTTWASTALTGSVAPGGRYLVQEAAGAGGTTPLPTPNASGNIAMSASSGKVRLSAPGGVRDLVGYGSANEFEGTGPAPTLSNTTAALRAGSGATDTDNNAADFTAGAPAPGAGGGPGPDPDPTTPALIREIQGTAHKSPLTGQLVGTSGVVTAVGRNGFWIQDPAPDADPATSEGIFVFTSTRPTVAVADDVRVAATVSEFRGSSSTSLTLTELSKPTVTVVSHDAAVPAATLVGPGGRVAPVPVRTDAPGDVETTSVFDASANALDFWESMEGMLVRIVDSVASGPTNSFGELSVLPGGAGSPRTVHGGVRYTYEDANAERVILDDILVPTPVANVGDVLAGQLDGVLDYSFGNFKFLATTAPTLVPGGLTAEVTRAQSTNELAIATYNVENLDPNDPIEKFDRLAQGLVTNLSSPDIVAVEEMQDNNGIVNDGTVAADVTFGMLIDAIKRAGGPVYDFRSVNPENLTDGGEPGGNIRVGFLFRTDRDITFVDRGTADATTATTVVRDGNLKAGLSLSPGRIDPTNPAFADSRKPLAGQFEFRGRTFFVIANHFSSKGGDQPLFGRYQPPTRSSETKRHAQAAVVRSFIDSIFAVNPAANVVMLGDLNDFEFSETADILVGNGSMVDLPRTLTATERYSYVFDGNSQVLDHTMVSLAATQLGYDYDVVHINAEFADQASDHDPQVVRIKARADSTGTPAGQR